MDKQVVSVEMWGMADTLHKVANELDWKLQDQDFIYDAKDALVYVVSARARLLRASEQLRAASRSLDEDPPKTPPMFPSRSAPSQVIQPRKPSDG